MAESINLHIHIDVLGPVTIIGSDPQQEETVSELTDVVQALVAEDSLVVQTLDSLKAKVDAGGTISAGELAADVQTLKDEHDKLVSAVAADTTTIPGSSTTGTGPVSAPGSAPGDPTVPPAGTTPVTPDPAPAPATPGAPLDDSDPTAAPVDGGSTGPQEPAAASPAPEAPAAS